MPTDEATIPPSDSARPPVAQPSPASVREVPLTAGLYVVAGEDCRQPANAGWRVWDEKGLSGSATADCRATVVARSGRRYTLSNDCRSTYDGSRSAETIVITVADQAHFSTEDGAFAACPAAQVPAWLRDRVTGPATADAPVGR